MKQKFLPLLKAYKAQIVAEAKEIVNDVISLVDKYLLPRTTSAKSKIICLKQKGDFCSYYARFITGDELKDLYEKGREAYARAAKMAKELDPTDTERLGIAVAYSTLLHDDGFCAKAHKVSKVAFSAAVSFDSNMGFNEEMHKNLNVNGYSSMMHMQLLRDNCTLWAEEMEEENGGEANH